MAKAGDGRIPYASGGAGEKFLDRHFQPEKSTGMPPDEGENSAASEQMLEQETVIRSKIQQPTTIEHLPDELLINIFIRLFSKQLSQMRSISKSWNALLSHPSFVKSHLHHSIHNNNHHSLLVFHSCYKPYTQYSCQSPHLEPTNFIPHTHTPVVVPMGFIGAVNGLICLSKSSYSDIHIWNPSLSAMSAIPLPQSPTPIFPYISYVRFGFDPKSDDYKLVKLLGLHSYDNTPDIEWMRVEVYSMRKRSWKFITQPFPSHITRIENTDYVCVDGHDGRLHWQNRSGPWTERTILAFDLGSETFREMPLPDSNHGMNCFGVLAGKVCEMRWWMDGPCEVWVMEEYGVPESWVKRHVFTQFTDAWIYPYGFTSRNELLLEDKDGRLVLYDPVANKTKLTHTKQRAVQIVEYVDSLVWF